MRWSDPLGEATLLLLSATFAAVGYGWFAETSSPFELSLRDPSGLRVVTWNVGGQDGQPMNDEWMSAISEALRQTDADLVFLQEVQDRQQLDRLLNLLGTSWRGAIVRRGDRRVAVVHQRGPVRASAVRTDTGRDALLVEYRSKGRPAVVAVSLHADAFSASKRNRQIGRATDALRDDSRAGAKLLAGDLNLDLDLDKRRDLFTDAEHRDVESYNYIASQLFDVGIGRGSTAEPDRRLDYIFINAELGVSVAGAWKGRRVGEMDHDPVVADLRFVHP